MKKNILAPVQQHTLNGDNICKTIRTISPLSLFAVLQFVRVQFIPVYFKVFSPKLNNIIRI